MSQTTLDPNTPTEDSAAEQQPSKQQPRRRRRPAARKGAASPAEAAAVATPAQPAAETIAPAQVADQQVSAPAPTGETARPSGGRARSRRSSGRKKDVQLVMPPAPAAPLQQEETAASAPGEVLGEAPAPEGAPSVRTVPVTTEAEVPAAATAGQPSEALTVEPAVTPSPARSRYRFGRRQTALAAAQPPARPERLSGALASAVGPDAREGGATAEAGVVPELGAAEAEEQPSPSTRDVLEDIVSALGLREAGAEAQPEEIAPEGAGAEAAAGPEGEPEAGAEGAEAQTGVRRRRRRRRGGVSHTGADEESAEQAEAPEGLVAMPFEEPETEPGETNGRAPYGGYEYEYPQQAPYSPYSRPTRERAQPEERQPWDVVTGSQQIRQPESPFGAPEPSFARGFGPQPRGVAGPARESYSRTGRAERTDVPPMSPNVLAATVTHAIQQQTDRLLSELRHQANPPAMTVMFPPFPSTERVGVFVDVANLLYSARNLRISIDFGRLLDFLRGNRRLIRAHAYAPTNPDPHAEQAFLSAVKGLGYRITTKNYKTFSSGAKKADMDLDLCMDIVRLVDAKALDTVVLVSGDSDFLPLLEYCSDRGVRVEVAAFDDSAAMILRQSCDLFINLSLVDDIRA